MGKLHSHVDYRLDTDDRPVSYHIRAYRDPCTWVAYNAHTHPTLVCFYCKDLLQYL